MASTFIEAVFALRPVRWAVAAAFLARGSALLWRGRLYRALVDFCWIERVSDVGPLRRIARRVIFRSVETTRAAARNPIVTSYQGDPASVACGDLYSITGRGHHDLFRDVIVLKGASSTEKGVILLKYVRTFDAMNALFDVPRLMERYVFVLEPCWAGYCDPSLLMFLVPRQPVFVQCFTVEDFEFVEQVGAPLVPLRMGPADWVDADLFKPRSDRRKIYDLVMVANWARHKRHAQLFRALKRIGERDVKVLLIGFAHGGRTANDVRRESDAIGNPRVTVDILDSVPASQVADHVSQARAFVFLSRKEGDNKALVEAMFADVPAVVYRHTIGGARSRINGRTGVLADDDQLAARIVEVLDHADRFAPREWATAHTGSANSTRVLDETIRRTMAAVGQTWSGSIVEKTNSPNLAYKNPSDRVRFQADYQFILQCRRNIDAPGRANVA